MDVRTLHSFCVNANKNFSRYYRGIYSLSSFSKVALDLNTKNFFFIIHKEHFCAVMISYESYNVLVAFIDPLASISLFHNAVIQDYLLQFTGSIESVYHLNYRIQPVGSYSCSKYCLYFVYYLVELDYGWNQILSAFSQVDLNKNEQIISSWFQKWTKAIKL